MIEVSVEKRHGAATVRSRVIAESIEKAIELAGEDACVVFPIDPERFFVRGKRRGAPCGTRPPDMARGQSTAAMRKEDPSAAEMWIERAWVPSHPTKAQVSKVHLYIERLLPEQVAQLTDYDGEEPPDEAYPWPG